MESYFLHYTSVNKITAIFAELKQKTMKNESQNIEYKETWRDEYLKWICGFANAQGGRVYIGVNDKKEVTGLSDSKRLMEDIPNKITNYLGIVADVNLLYSGQGKEYIQIAVEPSNVPIAYHGQYHYRTGSTKQELKGVALQQFILKKMVILKMQHFSYSPKIPCVFSPQ